MGCDSTGGGLENSIFLLIFEWPLQQCSAIALPVIKKLAYVYYVLACNYQSVYGAAIIRLFSLLMVLADGISIDACGFLLKYSCKNYAILHFGGGGSAVQPPLATYPLHSNIGDKKNKTRNIRTIQTIKHDMSSIIPILFYLIHRLTMNGLKNANQYNI